MARLVFIALSCVLLASYLEPCSAIAAICRELPDCFKITQGLCNKDRTRDVCLVYQESSKCGEGSFFGGANETDIGRGGICLANEPDTFNPPSPFPLHKVLRTVTQPVRSGTPLCEKTAGPHVEFGIRFGGSLVNSDAQDRIITLGDTEEITCTGYKKKCGIDHSDRDILIKVPVEVCPIINVDDGTECDDCTTVMEPCGTECGNGYKLERYTCKDETCSKHGHHKTFHPCVGTNCPEDIDGTWCPWQALSHCSRNCGGGLMTRHRSCTCEPPSGNGKVCPGDDIESVACGTRACPRPKPRRPRKPRRRPRKPSGRGNLKQLCKRKPNKKRCQNRKG